MAVTWKLNPQDWSIWAIDIAIPGSPNTQCLVFTNFPNNNPDYSAVQAQSLVNAVVSEANTFSTATIPVFDFPGVDGTQSPAPELADLTFAAADWNMWYNSWSSDPANTYTARIGIIVPSNAMTNTQQRSLVNALYSAALAIGSLPFLMEQFTPQPNSLLDDPAPLITAYASVCSANYTSTAAGDLAGTSISVVVTKANSTITATGVFDMQSGTATGACAGIFNWNGTDQAGRAGVGGPVGTRSTAQQTWIVTGVAPGTYTAKLRGSVNTGGTIRSTNTTLSINVS